MARFKRKKKKTGSKNTDHQSQWHRAQNRAVKPPTAQISANHGSIPETLQSIQRLSVEELPLIIQQAGHTENVLFQHKIIDLCLWQIMLQTCPWLNDFKLCNKQVHTLHQLIFGKSNTLLIAHTGFSKSLIFHIYSVLIGKITIQIIPLNKLSNKQLDNIKKINGSHPVFVNTKTKSQEKSLITKIQKGACMHILLRSKQASTKSFQDTLKEPDLQSQVGLVVINEYHFVKEWEGF